MTGADLFGWPAGVGWLVLGGGGSRIDGETGDMDAAALGWADLDRGIAVLLTSGVSADAGEALLDYFADLGGPSGIVVPMCNVEDAHGFENCRLLAESGFIYLGDGSDGLDIARTLRGSPALGAMIQTFREGATILGMGSGASALGAWTMDPKGTRRPEPGLGLLQGAIVKAHFADTRSSTQLRRLLLAHPDCAGLGIPDGVALALGPGRRVETVGDGQVTVILNQVDGLPGE